MGRGAKATMGGVFEGTQPCNGRLCCGYLASFTFKLYHSVISTLGLLAHLFQEMVSYVVFMIDPCERGDDYSEAKIITELCALAHSSVASQYITWFPVARSHCF